MTQLELRRMLDENLTVPIWPHAGTALGYGRTFTYEQAQAGKFPGQIQKGSRYVASTAVLRKVLGLDQANAA